MPVANASENSKRAELIIPQESRDPNGTYVEHVNGMVILTIGDQSEIVYSPKFTPRNMFRTD
jgi:hypothetical protein